MINETDPDTEVWQTDGHHIAPSDGDDSNCCCSCCSSCSSLALERIKVVLLLLGVVLGVSFGVGLWYVPIFHDEMYGPRMLMYLRIPSQLIVNLTTLIAIPTTITSLVGFRIISSH